MTQHGEFVLPEHNLTLTFGHCGNPFVRPLTLTTSWKNNPTQSLFFSSLLRSITLVSWLSANLLQRSKPLRQPAEWWGSHSPAWVIATHA